MHTAEFFEKFGDLDSAVCLRTAELDSAAGCTPQGQTDSKMSVFRVFVLATSFLGQFVTYSINFV